MRRFVIALIAVGILGGCARAEERPSGVAESWLQEVANQGRSGTRADAAERAAELGDEAVARTLIPANPEPDERYFSDFEVGKAVVAGDGSLAEVPYRLSARTIADGKPVKVVKSGRLVLQRTKEGWRVSSALRSTPALAVPSQGGDLPARAKGSQWLTALVLGLILTAGSVLIIERQPKPRSA